MDSFAQSHPGRCHIFPFAYRCFETYIRQHVHLAHFFCRRRISIGHRHDVVRTGCMLAILHICRVFFDDDHAERAFTAWRGAHDAVFLFFLASLVFRLFLKISFLDSKIKKMLDYQEIIEGAWTRYFHITSTLRGRGCGHWTIARYTLVGKST